MRCVFRCVTHQESDEPLGLQSGPWQGRRGGGGQFLSYYSSRMNDGKGLPPLKKKELLASDHGSWSTCGATILQLSNFLFSTTSSGGWYEAGAGISSTVLQTEQSREENIKRYIQALWYSWISTVALKVGLVLELLCLGYCWVSTVRCAKKKFLSFWKKKKNPPSSTFSLWDHLSVVLGALQELLFEVI